MLNGDPTVFHLELEDILSNTLDGVFLLDRQRRFIIFNSACERITGYSRSDLLGSQCRCHSVTECEDEWGRNLSGRLCPGMQIFTGQLPSAKQRMRIRHREGRHVWIETNYTPMKDREGQVACVLGVMRDITEAKDKEDQLRETTQNLREEVERLRAEIHRQYGFGSMVSRSPKMRQVFERVRAACTNSSSVLIGGESGAGKEVVARTIHHHGLQKDGPFVPLNASALSKDLIESELFGHVKGAFTGASIDFEGLFRAAEDGTIFLDEIAEMPSETQAKLLRALQDKRVRPVGSSREVPVNARVIAATNRNIADAVAGGRIRKDLYYRLSVITIEVPALRERKDDIPFLVEHFVSQFNTQSLRQVKTIHPDVWRLLLQYDWPGNVRELQNAIESAFAIGSGPELEPVDLPDLVRGETIQIHEDGERAAQPLDEMLASVERRAILTALQRAGGQRSRAARLMGVSRSRLYRRMQMLAIDDGQAPES
ncbi:MAG TPA: sigma 54-interacting transcriptional regulator [Phycisphaerae bacterium]|jgi:two-component system response regulator AtoC